VLALGLGWATLVGSCRADSPPAVVFPATSTAWLDEQIRDLKTYAPPGELSAFLTQTRERADAAGDNATAAIALMELGKQLRTTDGARAAEMLEQAAARLRKSPNAALEFRYRLLRIGQLKTQHELDKALREGMALLADARARRDWRDELKVLLALEEDWETFHSFGRFTQEAMQLAVAHPGDELTWWARSEWADRLRSDGKLDEAERMHLAILQEQAAANDGVGQIRSLVALGLMYRDARQWDKLLPLGPRALKVAKGMGRTPNVLPHFLCNQSDALLLANMPAPALEMADAAIPVARGRPGLLHAARFNRGKALNRLGKHQEGLAILEAEAQGDDRWQILEEVAEEYAFAGLHDKAYGALIEHLQGLRKSNEEAHQASLRLDQALADADRERAQRVASERQLGWAITGAAVVAAAALAAAALLVVRTTRRHARALAAVNRQLQEAAATDALTGLHNRRHFMSQIGAHAAAADRSHRTGHRSTSAPVDLIFFLIDLDHFKRVNDVHGHPAGDAVLQQAAARIKSVVRADDELIRWGGEEFLLLTRGTPRDHASLLAERLRRVVEAQPVALPDGQKLGISCSVGFAPYPLAPGVPWQQSVELADQAMYQAKARGRNGWFGVTGLKSPSAPAALGNLEQALAEGALEPVHS
jgi:diguanylate cyclase (GGDEF)-like protein